MQVWPAGPNCPMRIVYNGGELPLGKLEKVAGVADNQPGVLSDTEFVSRAEFEELLRQMQRFASRVDSEFEQVRKMLDSKE